jgi:hypothetical protein
LIPGPMTMERFTRISQRIWKISTDWLGVL